MINERISPPFFIYLFNDDDHHHLAHCLYFTCAKKIIFYAWCEDESESVALKYKKKYKMTLMHSVYACITPSTSSIIYKQKCHCCISCNITFNSLPFSPTLSCRPYPYTQKHVLCLFRITTLVQLKTTQLFMKIHVSFHSVTFCSCFVGCHSVSFFSWVRVIMITKIRLNYF
jgi:hypothetical protein